MTGFIKISNSLFNHRLTPSAFFVYCAMLSKANIFKSLCVTYAELSKLCHMDAKTVQKAVSELVAKRLLSKSNRYNSRGYIANRYTLSVPTGGWFKLQREVFGTDITPSAFMTYCFIMKFMSDKGSFPSINAISDKENGTGLSKTTVCKALRYLRSYSFLNRIHRRFKDTQAYRHNRYIKVNYLKKDKKRWRSPKQPSAKEKYRISNLSNLLQKVKSFFVNCRVVQYFLNTS